MFGGWLSKKMIFAVKAEISVDYRMIAGAKLYKTCEDGEKDIFKYVEVFYNRKHISLCCVRSAVYEETHKIRQGRMSNW